MNHSFWIIAGAVAGTAAALLFFVSAFGLSWWLLYTLLVR